MAGSSRCAFTLVALAVLLYLDTRIAALSAFTLAGIWIYNHRRNVYIGLVTLPRDLRMASKYIRVLVAARRLARDNTTVWSSFSQLAARRPDSPCFYFEDAVWTYKDMLELANRVAHVFQDAGLTRGDHVALCMENRPEYVAVWLGLSQLGVVTALINTNLRLQPLVHSLQVAAPKAVVFTSQFAPALEAVSGSLSDMRLYEWSDTGSRTTDLPVKDLSQLLADASTTAPLVAHPPGIKDKLLYIYTSGTTGLPKAAILPQSRYLLIAAATKSMLALRLGDVTYNPLPLYHTAGGLMGTGTALIYGIPAVIRPKFSASNYWTDCIKYNCTVGQYIGEMCRYILACPPRPEDSQHRVRLMVGNGLRVAIWTQFVNRFKIAEIRELYGATEGNVNIVNIDNTVGAVGCLPSFVRWGLRVVVLIRLNQETGEPVRDANGLCIVCDVDEPGMFVGLINSRNPASQVHGYLDQEASKKKIMHNVLSQGDSAFISGDVLSMNEYGYVFFKDRTGDTFRWKGENVATAEVESIISNATSLTDAAVYGVEVPGMEGKAGMAAILDPDNKIDIAALSRVLEASLPPYARPIFLRLIKCIDMTGTYKLRKVDLQKEGYDPRSVADTLYFLRGKSYLPLTEELYQSIVEGKERL